MTVLEEKQNVIDDSAVREAALDALLAEIWDARETRRVYGTPVGYSIMLTHEQGQRIMALLDIDIKEG